MLIRPSFRRRHVASAIMNNGGGVQSVTTTGSLAGDLIVSLIMHSGTADRTPNNAGIVAISGSGASATSQGRGGYFIAPSADVAATCANSTTTGFETRAYRGAKTLHSSAVSVETNSTITLPACKGRLHGGVGFIVIMSETAALSLNTDNSNATFVSSQTSGSSRHRWSFRNTYGGGSAVLSGSGEFWIYVGIAV